MPLSPRSFSVLVVMDDVYAQKALTEYARHAGYLSSGVSDPRKAAATIAQNPTHLIIVDCDKNTTRDFVDAVRKHKPHLIVVGFVDNLPGVEQQAEDGINGYLVRPLSQDAVTDQLNELLLKEAETGPPPKVVVIDDDADAVTAVEHVLQVRGFEVNGFQDPGEGIVFMAENPPDVIILDVQMPNITGFEVLQTIQKNPTIANIPVLIFTSDPSRDNVQKAIEAGAKGFLAKPFDPKGLTEKSAASCSNRLRRRPFCHWSLACPAIATSGEGGLPPGILSSFQELRRSLPPTADRYCPPSSVNCLPRRSASARRRVHRLLSTSLCLSLPHPLQLRPPQRPRIRLWSPIGASPILHIPRKQRRQ